MIFDYDVIGIGIPYLDYIVNVSHEELENNNLALGQSGSLDQGLCQKLAEEKGYTVRCGGPAANTLAGLAAMGARCGHIGVLGADEAGIITRDNLGSRGIDQLYQNNNDRIKSPVLYALVTPDGERTFVPFINDAGKISADNLPVRLGTKGKIFYLQTRFIGRDNLIPVLSPVLNEARKCGAKVIFGLQSFKSSDSYTQNLITLIDSLADFVIGNDEECQEFYKATPQNLDRFVVIRTKGAEGAAALIKGEIFEFPISSVRNIVDAIGAGDQFTAGFIFGLLQKLPLSDCVALGFRTAREILQMTGGQPDSGADWRPLISMI